MRRFNRILPLFAIGILIALAPVYAKTVIVKSKITEINAYSISKFIGIHHLDPQTGKTEEIRVEVRDSTLWGDVGSIEGLKVGDEVVIEADYNAFTHDWKAQSIKRFKQT